MIPPSTAGSVNPPRRRTSKPRTTGLVGVSPRPGVAPAMLRLQIVDAAGVAVGAGNLAQPRAPPRVLARLRIDPDVIHALVANREGLHPRQNVLPPRRLPATDIRLRRAGRERTAHVDAAVSALPTCKVVLLHTRDLSAPAIRHPFAACPSCAISSKSCGQSISRRPSGLRKSMPRA